MDFDEVLGRIEDGERPATAKQIETGARMFARLSGIEAPPELRAFWAISNGLDHNGLELAKAGGRGDAPSLTEVNAGLGDELWTILGTQDDDILAYCAPIERWVSDGGGLDVPDECGYGVFDTCGDLLRHALGLAYDLDLPDGGCTPFEAPPKYSDDPAELPSIDAFVGALREQRPRWLRRPKKAGIVADAYRDTFGGEPPEAWLHLLSLTNGVEGLGYGVYGVGRPGWDLAERAGDVKERARFRAIGTYMDPIGQRVRGKVWTVENLWMEGRPYEFDDCDGLIRWLLAQLFRIAVLRPPAPDA